MSSRGRFISHKEFGNLIADLRLGENSFQDDLLEFLECQRIIIPVARVRWPVSIVIEEYDGVPIPEPTQTERDDAQALSSALNEWRRPLSDPELPHPFDLGAKAPGAQLFTIEVDKHAFVSWRDFRTNIKGFGEEPVYVDRTVDTYYHHWQVLLVADALEMGMRLIFDIRRKDLFDAAFHNNWSDLPRAALRASISFTGAQGLEKGLKWARWLDAVAKFEVVRSRKLVELSCRKDGRIYVLENEDLDDFNIVLKRVAANVMSEINGSRDQMRSFLVYLCERWDEWRRFDRNKIAEKYKAQINQAIRVAIYAFDTNFEALSADVGIVTSHFENILDVIFPNWNVQARDNAELSLRHSVVAKAPTADSDLILDDGTITDFLDWVECNNHWKLYLGIESILEHQFKASIVNHNALAKEVESLSATFEHIVNDLQKEAGINPSDTLMRKMQKLWSVFPEIHGILRSQTALVSTRSVPRSTRLAEIAALAPTEKNIGVTRTLLEAVLYRNDGLHNGMVKWSETELHEATRIFLTAMMFCWKSLLVKPPMP